MSNSSGSNMGLVLRLSEQCGAGPQTVLGPQASFGHRIQHDAGSGPVWHTGLIQAHAAHSMPGPVRDPGGSAMGHMIGLHGLDPAFDIPCLS